MTLTPPSLNNDQVLHQIYSCSLQIYSCSQLLAERFAGPEYGRELDLSSL
jgi:hypothetical protein